MDVKDKEKLINDWQEVIFDLPEGKLDVDRVKGLIFSTYELYKMEYKGRAVKDEEAEPYKYVSQLYFSLDMLAFPDLPDEVSETLSEFLMGLSFIIENGWDVGFEENELPLKLKEDLGSKKYPVADMSSYEAFDASFTKMLNE
ncbi:MAG: hypothetical protein K6F00_00695 [Lachnospiraceae bacterium]|nr:hypothetical protein [Lachnospiraceae bacterium]